MDSHGIDRIEELPVADTPEDVAVLYSWANLHGAKYRDFSASRREYRAQLRHKAAEQVREQELKAQAEAEAAASTADAVASAAVIQAESVPLAFANPAGDSSREQSLREADRASRIASAERVEAARRAEAAAVAEAAARRAEREIAEASASARRQATQYVDSEIRNRESGAHKAFEVPGEISDPYTPNLLHGERPQERSVERRSQPRPRVEARPESTGDQAFENAFQSRPAEYKSEEVDYEPANFTAAEAEIFTAPETETFTPVTREIAPAPSARTSSSQRRQGYRPDNASGVKEIFRAPEFDEPRGEYVAVQPVRPYAPTRSQPAPEPPRRLPSSYEERGADQRSSVPSSAPAMGSLTGGFSAQDSGPETGWPFASAERVEGDFTSHTSQRREPAASGPVGGYPAPRRAEAPRATPPAVARPASLYGRPVAADAGRGRRVQDDLGYHPAPLAGEPNRRATSTPAPLTPLGKTNSTQRPNYASDPSGPAWLYAPQTPVISAMRPVAPPVPPVPMQSSVADTLQHSRERVAARWFALKGVFEQNGPDQHEVPVRQKEIRTPVLAVFSLAGGVGKTSLVATLGRSLSSMGEKVLLTDTTSHGLLPFYFGASELRQGIVRTFSPPSGSTDAPIYLVSYDVDPLSGDEAAQEQLAEDISTNSKGTHRILLDLTPGSGWVARRMATMNPTVLVPLAPDMNSVISLQAVEKYFSGVLDADGRPVQPYFLINQFDASLPLHLDVREVLRRQLGDRLLPFVIRRSPSVSEALAEGMTVMDYAPDTPIAEDYQNVAVWLRTIAAPATAGFRNVRWSER
ncbi:MAG: cellulose synthase operon protein YhjQ [Acidobacteriaceae bacterium]|nr:cellulose synthase operon protein YhjQ [Acidobacteriaceae bacterium]